MKKLILLLFLFSCVKEDFHNWHCTQTVISTSYTGDTLRTDIVPYDFKDLSHDDMDSFVKLHTYTGDRDGYTVESKCSCSESICS